MIHIIAAIGKNRELGKDNALLWQIPEDLRHFKELTLGHPVIMGRKTFDSIVAALGGPLPRRTSIVVTHTHRGEPSGTEGSPLWVCSFEDALARAQKIDQDVFVIGGAQIYEQALPHADVLHLTLIDDSRGADSFFPPYDQLFKEVGVSEWHEHGDTRYRFAEYKRL